MPGHRIRRVVQLALTEQGHAVTREAIAVVQELLRRLPEPLGGLDAPWAQAFTDELTTLLDAPLAPSAPNDESTQGTPP